MYGIFPMAQIYAGKDFTAIYVEAYPPIVPKCTGAVVIMLYP